VVSQADAWNLYTKLALKLKGCDLVSWELGVRPGIRPH